jgi:c-di-GMP-binding flagellar brake protein YcgR
VFSRQSRGEWKSHTCTLMAKPGQLNIAGFMKPSRAKTEKREHPRLSLRLPTEYSLEGSPAFRTGHTIDIGEGGLLIHVPEELSAGQRLRIRFYYHTSAGMESVQSFAEVSRVNRVEKSVKEYICALRFIDLPAGELNKVRKVIKAFS